MWRENIKGQLSEANVLDYEQGDRPTKHFLQKEKSRAINKTITKLTKDNGLMVTDPKEILNEQSTFYENLYTSSLSNIEEHMEDREKILQNIGELPIPEVNQKQSCEKHLRIRNMEDCL